MTITTTTYTFDCPEHGPESGIFCFRAFKHENRHLWHKYHAVLTEQTFNPGELTTLLDWTNPMNFPPHERRTPP